MFFISGNFHTLVCCRGGHMKVHLKVWEVNHFQICRSDVAYWIFSLDVGFFSVVMSLMIHGFINYECITKNHKAIRDTGVMLIIVIITESKGKIGQRGEWDTDYRGGISVNFSSCFNLHRLINTWLYMVQYQLWCKTYIQYAYFY